MLPLPPKFKYGSKLLVINPSSFYFGSRGIAIDHSAGHYTLFMSAGVPGDEMHRYADLLEEDLELGEDN